jgi:hypothetical protein
MDSRATTEQTARSLASSMTTIVSVLDRVLSNLSDNQPGYPSSTAFAGPASSVIVDDADADVRLNTVERLATRPDPARRDLDRLHELVSALRKPIDELSYIAACWSYVRTTPDSVEDDQVDWCVSCLRTHSFEPTYRLIDGVPLCWFCHDMQSRFRHRPSLSLLDKHSRGRVSDTARAADVAQYATKSKRKRKRAA